MQVQLAKGIATSGSHLREVTTNAEAPETGHHLGFNLGPRPSVALQAVLNDSLRTQWTERRSRLQREPCEDRFRVSRDAAASGDLEASKVLQLLLG